MYGKEKRGEDISTRKNKKRNIMTEENGEE
jgi:hypothetical protein